MYKIESNYLQHVVDIRTVLAHDFFDFPVDSVHEVGCVLRVEISVSNTAEDRNA